MPASKTAWQTVEAGRKESTEAIAGVDKRLMVIVGPCSIHRKEDALEYAHRLADLREKVSSNMIILMRVYFEKPRTILGWKGLIYDPDLNGTFDIARGLHRAREILLEINELGLPCATEFLDPIVPPYISDLISWVAIGARTTESQTHRQMASGLSMPVGFKNSTSGDVTVAFNALRAAASPQRFLGIDQDGIASILTTKGNGGCHIILRGGMGSSNYSFHDLKSVKRQAGNGTGKRQIMIDCSHGNTAGNYKNQVQVFEKAFTHYLDHPDGFLGLMLESHINEGKQPLSEDLKFGVSITDACIGWEETEKLLMNCHERLGER